MNIYLFIFFIISLQLVCLFAARQSTKKLDNPEDYYLAGKDLSFFPLTMTFVATQIGGGVIMGTAEEAYRIGWMAIFFPLGCALGLLLLGLGIGQKLARFNVSTIAQLFELVYGSILLKKIASLFSIISLFIILVAQVIASSKFMGSLGIDNKFLFFAFWGIVIFYTSLGGLKAVVATDVVQAIFFIAAFSICMIFIFFSSEIGFTTIIITELNSVATADFSTFYGWLLMPLLFMMIEQDMAQRCFAALNPKVVSKATICAGMMILLIVGFPIYLGLLARQMELEIPANSSVLMTAIATITTPALTALLGAAVLVAIISTADSLLNAISSNIAQDFTLLRQRSILISQVLSVGISILAIFCSFYFNRVVDLLVFSYELSVCCLFVPIFISFFKQKGNKQSAFLAILFGGLSFLFLRFISVPFPKEILSLIFSSIGFGLGEVSTYFSREIYQKKALY